jgi:hypothetical protein
VSNTVEVVEKNAYLECFMLHYRNILDFLVPRRDGTMSKPSTSAPTTKHTIHPSSIGQLLTRDWRT